MILIFLCLKQGAILLAAVDPSPFFQTTMVMKPWQPLSFQKNSLVATEGRTQLSSLDHSKMLLRRVACSLPKTAKYWLCICITMLAYLPMYFARHVFAPIL